MGKKNKNGPPYKPTSRKLLVVERAWTDNFNHIAAWFEIMIRAKYPDARVQTVFIQANAPHGCKIVELPSEVEDIRPYLGEHLYSRFLRHKPNSIDALFIYEYDYINHGKPEVKWNSEYPSNGPVPNNFPVIDPYPLPVEPFINPQNRPNFALRLPPRINQVAPLLPPQQLPNPPLVEAPAPIPSISSYFMPSESNLQAPGGQGIPMVGKPSPELQRTQSPISLHTLRQESTPVKKMDPYEEAEVAEELLRSLSPVKREEAAVDDFLSSLLPSIKTEVRNPLLSVEDPASLSEADIDPDQGFTTENYKPSNELLALFSEVLSQDEVKIEVDHRAVIIKPEPEDVKMPDYEFIAGLLPAFSNPPEDYLDHPGSSNSPVIQFRVKQEYEDNHGRVIQDMYRSVTVKEEPVDFSISRDPRKRHLYNHASSSSIGSSNTSKRDAPHSPDRGSKRVKTEEK